MKKKTILCLMVFILLLLSVGAAFYAYPRYRVEQNEKHEKQLVAKAIHYLDIMKKAVGQYAKRSTDAPKFDILLDEMLKLGGVTMPKGQQDNTLGVYSTPHFIYIGSCYSDWCYIEVTRKENSYTLYVKHNGKAWTQKTCSTQNTPLGQMICKHLESKGWQYQEGEI